MSLGSSCLTDKVTSFLPFVRECLVRRGDLSHPYSTTSWLSIKNRFKSIDTRLNNSDIQFLAIGEEQHFTWAENGGPHPLHGYQEDFTDECRAAATRVVTVFWMVETRRGDEKRCLCFKKVEARRVLYSS